MHRLFRLYWWSYLFSLLFQWSWKKMYVSVWVGKYQIKLEKKKHTPNFDGKWSQWNVIRIEKHLSKSARYSTSKCKPSENPHIYVFILYCAIFENNNIQSMIKSLWLRIESHFQCVFVYSSLYPPSLFLSFVSYIQLHFITVYDIEKTRHKYINTSITRTNQLPSGNMPISSSANCL